MPTRSQLTIERVAKPARDEEVYAPFGAARQLFGYRGREVLLAGPAGTGKSRACLEKVNLACMQRPIRAAIVRKTRKSITQSAMETFEEKVLTNKQLVPFHTGDQEYRYPNGAKVIVGGLDDAEKIGSTEFDLVYVQEATELEEEDWGMLLRGLRNGVLSYQQLIADCNPTYPSHWLKQRCERGETLLLESNHKDNPTLWDHGAGAWTSFGENYIRNLDSLQGYLYRRLRLGEWCAAEGMYFTSWTPERHIVQPFELPSDWPCWVSVDYGFAAPFCALWLTRNPQTKDIFVYREAYAPQLRDEQQAALIRAKSETERVVQYVLDPAMFNARTEQSRPSIAQVYANGGLWPIVPGMNSRIPGWAVVRRALAVDVEGGPRLKIFEGRCPNLVRTIPAMVMDPLDPEDVADAIKGVKTEDHAVDALRYGLCAEAQPAAPREAVSLRFGVA